MSQSESIDLLATAFCKAQSVMTAAIVNKTNPHYKSKYADLASVIEAIRKPLTANGLSITQTTEHGPDHFYLSTMLLHTSGQWLRSEYPLPTGATPQAMGSALTYARRYSLSAIAGIAADEDDDGNAVETKKPAAKPPLAESKRIAPREDDVEPSYVPLKEPPEPSVGEPHELAVPKLANNAGNNWRAFGNDLMAILQACDSKADVFAWIEKNTALLNKMRDAVPMMRNQLDKKIDEIKAEPS